MEPLAEKLKEKLSEQTDEEIEQKLDAIDNETLPDVESFVNMTNKELLNIDLCSRLPYLDTMVRYQDEDYHMIDIGFGRVTLVKPFWSITDGSPLITEVKPYLRPMSSMTEEEKKEWYWIQRNAIHVDYFEEGDDRTIDIPYLEDLIDWLNSHHFDYRGLIEKGLAIKVTPENDPYKQ